VPVGPVPAGRRIAGEDLALVGDEGREAVGAVEAVPRDQLELELERAARGGGGADAARGQPLDRRDDAAGDDVPGLEDRAVEVERDGADRGGS